MSKQVILKLTIEVFHKAEQNYSIIAEIDIGTLLFGFFYCVDYKQNVKQGTLEFAVDLKKKKLGSLIQQVDVWKK